MAWSRTLGERCMYRSVVDSVTGELLDRLRRRALHREVRAEGMAELVQAAHDAKARVAELFPTNREGCGPVPGNHRRASGRIAREDGGAPEARRKGRPSSARSARGRSWACRLSTAARSPPARRDRFAGTPPVRSEAACAGSRRRSSARPSSRRAGAPRRSPTALSRAGWIRCLRALSRAIDRAGAVRPFRRL
jgi:hypothetical protein